MTTTQRAAARVIDAWDSTVLPVANDGRLQEAMEDLRAVSEAAMATPTLREAAQQALEALTDVDDMFAGHYRDEHLPQNETDVPLENVQSAITALRDALAAPAELTDEEKADCGLLSELTDSAAASAEPVAHVEDQEPITPSDLQTCALLGARSAIHRIKAGRPDAAMEPLESILRAAARMLAATPAAPAASAEPVASVDPLWPVDGLYPDMQPPATSRDRWMYDQGRLAERRLSAASPAAPAAQTTTTKAMREWLEGMSVSVDVSTGDHDEQHRYFGTVTEVMDAPADKHGVTLLVQDAEPNFAAPAAQALTDEHARKLCEVGPVYAPNGVVSRTPEQYRQELEAARLRGLRDGERAHGISQGGE